VLQLAAMQAAVIRGGVDLKTEVDIHPPGHPAEVFEPLSELFDGYDELEDALITASAEARQAVSAMLHIGNVDICAARPNDGGWLECMDPNGIPYRWNWTTQETTWDEKHDGLPMHPFQVVTIM
jgi:hypothetical protein